MQSLDADKTETRYIRMWTIFSMDWNTPEIEENGEEKRLIFAPL